MRRCTGFLICLFWGLTISNVEAAPAPPTAVVCDAAASSAEKLAAKEVRRYIYLRTGKLLPIVASGDQAPAGSLIAINTKDRLLENTVCPMPRWAS